MSNVSIKKEISLANTPKGVISVSKIEEPYGEGSATVASVGISLAGKATEPEWKVHIPLENLEEVIEALKAIK